MNPPITPTGPTPYVMPGARAMTPMVAAPVLRKLDLAAGQSPRDGFEGVDIWPKSKHVVDLMTFPWPFEDESVAELHCSHFIEHIPMEFVDELGGYVRMGTPGSKDLWLKFFEECHRILIPGGWITVVVPNARSNRGFMDPTHRRFHVAENFLYLAKEWRAVNSLDHYNTWVNFACQVDSTVPEEMMKLHPDAQTRRFNEGWNTIWDWVAKLQKLPR